MRSIELRSTRLELGEFERDRFAEVPAAAQEASLGRTVPVEELLQILELLLFRAVRRR